MSKEEMSGWGRMGFVGAGVAALSIGICVSEPIARSLAGGEPPKPQLPPVPQRVIAERGPMEAVVGFDTTRSAIKNELLGVVDQTRSFFAGTRMFRVRGGDAVQVCTFAEEAMCESFRMPEEQAALTQHIGRIRPEAPRAGMKTHVHGSISEMVEEVKLKDALVLGWTDAIDDEKGAKVPLLASHPPVAIIVPREGYREDAESVRTSLGTRGVEIAVANTSEQFGSLLERFAKQLEREAQASAQAIADQKYRQELTGYETVKAKYENDVETLEARRAEFVGKVRTFKNWIKGVLGGFALLVIGLTVREAQKQKNAPQTRYLVDRRRRFSKTNRFKVSRQQPTVISIGAIRLVFQMIDGGVVCNGVVLTDGEQVLPKVFYHVRDPGV